jgi:hypothetical protein
MENYTIEAGEEAGYADGGFDVLAETRKYNFTKI